MKVDSWQTIQLMVGVKHCAGKLLTEKLSIRILAVLPEVLPAVLQAECKTEKIVIKKLTN